MRLAIYLSFYPLSTLSFYCLIYFFFFFRLSRPIFSHLQACANKRSGVFLFDFHFFFHGSLWRIAVTHGRHLTSSCYIPVHSLLPTGYAWSVFHFHRMPLDFFLRPSVIYFFHLFATGCALLYSSGDTLCLHLLCLARVILSLHMLCLFRVWDFGHQVGSRESARMNSICGSHQGKIWVALSDMHSGGFH